MRISEKELTKILQRPGYSAHIERRSHRQPSPVLPEGSKHEMRFIRIWDALDGPELEREAKLIPGRNHRCDFFHKASSLVIEIEGFGHAKSNRYNSDIFKYNQLAQLGYELIRLTSDMITVQELEKILQRIKEKTA
jgi:very-short-patch-repair endonuclease